VPSTAPLRYDGRVAIVTGAGGGLGRAYALLLASRGAKVVVNDLGGTTTGEGKSASAADKGVAEIRAAGGQAVADYNSVEDGDKIVDTALAAFKRVDILICNAGILRDVTFQKMTDAAWEAVYRVHLRGTYKCARGAWNVMREAGYGRIVFVTSSTGLYGNFGQANYGAAKMGIVGLANTLAREGARRGIHVNTIAPIAASRMTESLLPPDLLKALAPDAVAPLVAYLCHESCMTSAGIYELGAGWASRLRWQRSKGAFYDISGGSLSPEAVRDGWDAVNDFDAGATFPDSTQSAFEPIMANLKGGAGADEASDEGDENPAARAAGRAVASGGAGGAASAGSDGGAGVSLPPLPGGNFGSSDAVDVRTALAHKFKGAWLAGGGLRGRLR
jgi:3-hydroxyacyl-CoA dehydrogenase/3a,7a,12a-trihydroxy-5b-cholest-24-enoyl-CoA hydratase